MTDNKVVAPVFEPMSLDQAGRACDRFMTRVRKDPPDLPHPATQLVLEEEGQELAQDWLDVLRVRAERRAKMFMRRVRVDRTRTREKAIAATGRVPYVDADVLATAPAGVGEWAEVWFFDLDYDPTPTELAREYEVRKLVPDFAAQAAVNEEDSAFADERPNGLQWGLQKDGTASFSAFDHWRGGRRDVSVSRDDGRWGRGCRFGGVRKK